MLGTDTHIHTYRLGTDTHTHKQYPSFHLNRAPLVAQLVKNLPAMQEILVQFLGQEDPLEKG